MLDTDRRAFPNHQKIGFGWPPLPGILGRRILDKVHGALLGRWIGTRAHEAFHFSQRALVVLCPHGATVFPPDEIETYAAIVESG